MVNKANPNHGEGIVEGVGGESRRWEHGILSALQTNRPH